MKMVIFQPAMLVFRGGVSYVFRRYWCPVGIIIRCSLYCTLSGMGFKTHDLCDILPLYIFRTYTLQFQRYPSNSANPPNQLQLPNPNLSTKHLAGGYHIIRQVGSFPQESRMRKFPLKKCLKFHHPRWVPNFF